MKRRDAGEIDRWRVAVFVAVVALHVLVGLLLFATGTIRVGRPPAVEAPLALVWLSLKSPARLPVAAAASIPTHTPKRKEALPEIQRQPEAATLEPSNAITLPLDLSADADAAARREAQKEGKERRWRNLAGPSESQLQWWRNNAPGVRDSHQGGDEERAEGGELIAWMNSKCFYTTHGLTTLGLPQMGTVCKDPPKPETDLFKDMRKKLDDGAKGPAP